MASRISRKGCTLGRPGSPRGFWGGEMGLYAGPFGIGEVGLVCSSHARYSTELPSQDPFSDGFSNEVGVSWPLRTSRSEPGLWCLLLSRPRLTKQLDSSLRDLVRLGTSRAPGH